MWQNGNLLTDLNTTSLPLPELDSDLLVTSHRPSILAARHPGVSYHWRKLSLPP